MAAKGELHLSYLDYDGETGKTRLHWTAITAANFDAQNTLRTNLVTAIAGICNGVLAHWSFGNADSPAATPPADQTAQRELRWLVQYHDNSTLKKYKAEIPCPDMAVLDDNDRAHAEIGDGDVVDAFVTAFEAGVISDAGNAITVDEITLVGRNR
jgi:hypothetical protein